MKFPNEKTFWCNSVNFLPFHDFSTILLIIFLLMDFQKNQKIWKFDKEKKIKEKEFSEHCDNWGKGGTTRKLTNTNEHIDEIFSSVDCDEFFWLNMYSQYPSVNTDKNIFLIYTKRITMENEWIKKINKKYDDMMKKQYILRGLQTELPMDLNSSIKFVSKSISNI